MRKLLLVTLASSVALIPAAAFAQGNHRGGGHGASHRGSSMSVRHGGSNVNVRHHGRSNVTVRHGGRTIHRGSNFSHRRFSRGFVMNRFWLAPRFHVRNWQLYGFAPPPADYRWVRYYNDAYLVDGAGRVHDSRHDLDWDEYGER